MITRIISHKAFSFSLKVTLLCLSLYFIYSKVDTLDFYAIQPKVDLTFWFYLLLFITLWILNISFDALSWQKVRKMRENTSWFTALKHNLICQALAFVTPMNSGELIGRYNSMQDKSKYLFVTFWFHLPKFTTKLIFLSVSLAILAIVTGNYKPFIITASAIAALLVVLLIYFNFTKLQRFLRKYQLFKKSLQDYILSERPYFSEKLELLIINMVRFIIYNMQFVVMVLLLTNSTLEIDFLIWVPVYYVLGTFITTIPAFDFVIKSALSIWLFNSTAIDETVLLLVPAIVWLFNLALPSLAGVYFIMKVNLSEKLQKLSLTR